MSFVRVAAMQGRMESLGQRRLVRRQALLAGLGVIADYVQTGAPLPGDLQPDTQLVPGFTQKRSDEEFTSSVALLCEHTGPVEQAQQK